MPCYINGQKSPVGRAACVAGGGTWGPANPYADAFKPTVPEKWGQATSKADAFLKDIPVFGDVYNFLNPSSDISKFVETISDPELRNAAINWIKENPKTATVGALTAYVASKSKALKSIGKYLREKVPNRYKKKAETVYPISKPQPKAGAFSTSTAVMDAAKVYIADKLIRGREDQPGALSEMGILESDNTTLTDNTSDSLTLPWQLEEAKAVEKFPSLDKPFTLPTIPAVEKAKTIPAVEKAKDEKRDPTFLENIQNKDWWFESMSDIPGDNRLNRIARGIAFISTPQSKRGDNPTDILREQLMDRATLKDEREAAYDKAQELLRSKQSTANLKTLRDMIPSQNTLMKLYLTDKDGFFKDSDPGTPEYAAAATKTAEHLWLANSLVREGIDPSIVNVEALKRKLEEKRIAALALQGA